MAIKPPRKGLFRNLNRLGDYNAQPNQSRNALSALGDAPVQATVYGVWFIGIGIGIVLLIFLAGFSIFNQDKPLPGAQSVSDRNSFNQLTPEKRLTYVKEGQTLFNNQGCVGCHLGGGYQAGGAGPQLNRSANARDHSYVQHLVRWGYNPMPAYSKAQLSDQDLYKITAYLQFIHENPPEAIPK